MKHNSLIRHPGFSSEYRNWTVWLLAVFIAFAMCGAAQAQPTKKNVRIGFLAQVSSSAISARIDAFRQGLRDLGYVEGQNLKIEWRDAGGGGHRLDGLAKELVRMNVDVIVTAGPTATHPAKEAPGTISTVMGVDNDPLAPGVLSGLRPARWPYYWAIRPLSRAKRQKTGTAKRNRSQTHPRRDAGDFHRTGQCANPERNRTRRKSVRDRPQIPRREGAQRCRNGLARGNQGTR